MRKDEMRLVILHRMYKYYFLANFIRGIEWRTVLQWLDPNEQQTILDVACGWGLLSLKIADSGCKVHGIDISEDAIRNAKLLAERKQVACEFGVGSADNLPYPDAYFDKVVCSSSLEHFENDIKALQEMNRVLKEKGTLILTVDSFTYPLDDRIKEEHKMVAHVVNYYTVELLSKKFDTAGFDMIRYNNLLNSPITSYFFKIGIKTRWRGLIWWITSPVAYYLCLVSDWLCGKKDVGYTLIAEGKKG